MSTNHKNSEADILDRATAALRHSMIPPLPRELHASTFEAMQRELQLDAEPQRRLRDWKHIMIRTAQFSAAAIVLIGMIVAGVMLTTPRKAIAFADVQKAMENLRTVKFTADVKMPDRPATIGTVYITAEGLMRQESPRGLVIADVNKGVWMTTDREAKKAIISRGSAHGFGINPLATLSQLAAADAKLIREEDRDGAKTLVFYVRHADLIGMHGELTVWVDPKTKLPVRIQLGRDDVAQEEGNTSIVLRDFVWDQRLDPKLFSMDVPEGYEMVEQDVVLTRNPTPHLIAALEVYTQLSGGAFPEVLDATTHERLEKKLRAAGSPWPLPGGPEKLMRIAQAGLAAEQLKERGYDWHYAGANVKRAPGEPGRPAVPILWFKENPLAERYHVIFADLTTREVDAAELDMIVGK